MATNNKPLQAGDLDRKLDVFTLDTHRSTKGEIGQSESPFLQGVYCQKKDKGEVGATEDVQTNRQTAIATTLFTIRYRNDLKETMTIYCEGIKYDIISIRESETRRQWTIIEAKKHN